MPDDQFDELSAVDDSGAFPVCREVALVASHQKISTSRFSAFQKAVVALIRAFCDCFGRMYRDSRAADAIKERCDLTGEELQPGVPQHALVFLKEGIGNIQAGLLAQRERNDASLEALVV